MDNTRVNVASIGFYIPVELILNSFCTNWSRLIKNEYIIKKGNELING